MPGGKGNIKPSDGKQFSIGNNAAEKWTEDEALKLGYSMLEWFSSADENIFFEDFLFLYCLKGDYKGKIYRDLPVYLAGKFTSFFDILETCKVIEKVKLKKFGAFDKLNASIVKFLLSTDHGLSETKNIKINGDVTGFLPDGFED